MKYFYLLYIDPGTGAALFTIILGLVTSLSFAMKKGFIKIKFWLGGGKNKDAIVNEEKIPFLIFSDHKRYWNVFKPICDEFEKRKQICYFWTASRDDPALEETYDYVKCSFIGEGNKAYARLNIVNACVFLATTPGLDVYQWKRSKKTEYYIHILHEVGGLSMYHMFGLDYYDAILLTGYALEDELREMESKRRLPSKEVYVTGSTYMDTLLDRYQKSRNRKSEIVTVLVAPSWGKNSLLNRLGSNFLEILKDTGYKIILRPHPQSQISEKELLFQLQREFPEGENWCWNFDNDNFEALSESDILISDFSGIIFDYALVFDKPVIYVNDDIDLGQYDACWLDQPTLREKILPKIGRKLNEGDMANLKELIYMMIESNEYHEEREIAKSLCWMYEGNSAKRTVDYLIDKRLEIMEKGMGA